jgi:hypothetical protein
MWSHDQAGISERANLLGERECARDDNVEAAPAKFRDKRAFVAHYAFRRAQHAQRFFLPWPQPRQSHGHLAVRARAPQGQVDRGQCPDDPVEIIVPGGGDNW